MNGEDHSETSAQPPDEGPDERGETFAGSGWTTTKQAAKVLGVSRRSVQGYVRRGLLEATDEGEGANKRFLVSIDSLNALTARRKREADEAAKFARGSAETESPANLTANTGETLRHVVDRLEARTEEATELRVRLELTARAESTLRKELADERRRREDAEREREDLRHKLEALEARESPESPGPSESPPPPATQQPTEAPAPVEEAESAEPQSDTAGPQTAPRRPQGVTLRGLRRRFLGW